MAEPKMNFELLSSSNAVFACYATWGSILLIKLLAMAPATSILRMKTKTFENPEDAPKGIDVGIKNNTIERIRRAHLNDLENIVPFMIVGLLFVLANPNKMLAQWLFRLVGISRIAHTVVYAIYPIRQPARAICFSTTFGILIYMCLYCIVIFHGF